MHHKYHNTKNQRAGCLMCKSNKMNGWNPDNLHHKNFGVIRRSVATKEELRQYKNGLED